MLIRMFHSVQNVFSPSLGWYYTWKSVLSCRRFGQFIFLFSAVNLVFGHYEANVIRLSSCARNRNKEQFNLHDLAICTRPCTTFVCLLHSTSSWFGLWLASTTFWVTLDLAATKLNRVQRTAFQFSDLTSDINIINCLHRSTFRMGVDCHL